MDSEKFKSVKNEVSEVVECVMDTKSSSVKEKMEYIVISLMITMRLITKDSKYKGLDKMMDKIVEHAVEDGDDARSIFVHVDILKSINMDYLKNNMIPFLVRINVNQVSSSTLFNTIMNFFMKIDVGRPEVFNSFKNLMNMNRKDYIDFLDLVSKGGKALTGATTSKTVATSTADESDLRLFIDDWSTKEKFELGVYLINNGNKMRSQKGTFEIDIEDEKTGNNKKIVVKFPRESEEITKIDFTYPKAAIVTARSVAKMYCNINDGGIKMSALALNIGWHGLFLEINLKKISDVFEKQGCQTVTEEKLYLCTIPRIRPHSYLNMDATEKYLMIIFYIINDIIISLKSGKDRFDFTSDTLSKMKTISFTPDSNVLKKTFAAIWNITRHHMSHKVQIGKEIAQFVKRILVAEREGRFSENLDDEGLLSMIDGLSTTVTEQEILNWSNKTRTEK